MSLAAQSAPLIAALEQLGPHDHFCSIYESPEEHYAVAIPFMQIGLDRGEKCIYIADDGTVGDVREAMHAEVEEGGTGHAAAVPGLQICGKTGTAEIMDEHNRRVGRTTWFISFAPDDKPRYAVVVMVEGGLFGGSSCAPAAKKIYEAILKAEQSKPVQTVAGR